MTDLNKLLDGSIEDVKAALGDLRHDDLLKLKTAEQGGKNRTGALAVIDAAIEAEGARRAGGVVQMAPDGPRASGDDHEANVAGQNLTSSGTAGIGIAADLDTSPPAEIAPATDIDTSGAPQQIVPDVDLDHPAVDADPRANTTEVQNRIDFNDPHKSGVDVVEAHLAATRD